MGCVGLEIGFLERHIYTGLGVLGDWKYVGVGGGWASVISYNEASG